MTETVTDKLPWFPFMGLSGWDHFIPILTSQDEEFCILNIK